jgi:hypothetical protein
MNSMWPARKSDTLVQAKQQLTAEVARLEVRQKMKEVGRSSTDFNYDESHLARTRDVLPDIETRIKVEERLADTELRLAVDRTVPLAETRDSLQGAHRIAEYFETSNSFADVDLESSTY